MAHSSSQHVNGYLTPPDSGNAQSVFLFVRPRETKSHYRPVSTLLSLTPPPSAPASTTNFSERPISMMGFMRSKDKSNDSRPSSSSSSKHGGMSLFGKTMKKKRSLTSLRLLNSDQPSPSISTPYSPSDAYFSDPSNTPHNESLSRASSSSSKPPSEEQLVAFPRISEQEDDGASINSLDKYMAKRSWVEKRLLRLHPYGPDAPYMLSYDSVMLENDRHFYMLLRRVNPLGSPSFYDYVKNGTPQPTSALDLGCGLGHWLLDAAVHWRDARIVGLDLVDVTLPEVHERQNIEFVRGNFIRYKLPFPANTFDLVRMANLSSCIPADRWEYVLTEVFRVLRYDGRLELIDDQRCFPYFKGSASKQLKSQDDMTTGRSSFSDRDIQEAPREVDPGSDAVKEQADDQIRDVQKHEASSFWEDGDEENRDDDEDSSESEPNSSRPHPYRIDTSVVDSEESSSSSSSSSVSSHEDKIILPLTPLLPVDVSFVEAFDATKEREEALQALESKSTRRLSYRPLPHPGRPLPRPPSTITIDTDTESRLTVEEEVDVTPTSAREQRAIDYAIRQSIILSTEEQIDAMAMAMALQASLDEKASSPLSITIPSDFNDRLLPSPLPDSPTEPSYQPSPTIPDSQSVLETPTLSSTMSSSTIQPTSPSTLQLLSPSTVEPPTASLPASPVASSASREWMPRAIESQNLETVYNGMLREKGIHTEPYQLVPQLMQLVFGAEKTGRLASMHLTLAPEEMSANVKTAKHVRGRTWTGGSEKKWMSLDWDKKEKVKKEAGSTPISPILEHGRLSSESLNSTSTPSKIVPEGISAKAAGRLGITYSELTAASASASRPSTSSSGSGSSGSLTLASSSRNSYDSHNAASDRSQDTIVESEIPGLGLVEEKWKPKQSPGLLLWPSTFIPMGACELEMHACKGMHELLGSKHALAEYVASKKDEDGKRIVSEQEFEDAIWQYDCFRRERLGWPVANPELNLDPYASEMPSYEDNVELPYTPSTASSIADAIKPRNSASSEFSDVPPTFGSQTHVRTIRIYEAVKTRRKTPSA